MNLDETFHDRWKRARMACNSRRKNYPPRVDTYDNGERYWSEPPPQLSPRCLHCMERIKAGWRPRLDYGYYGNSEYLGVYIWEYMHVISPLLNDGRVDVSGPPWRLAEDGKTVLR